MTPLQFDSLTCYRMVSDFLPTDVRFALSSGVYSCQDTTILASSQSREDLL